MGKPGVRRLAFLRGARRHVITPVMPMLIAGLLLLWLSSILLRGFVRGDPVAFARVLRRCGGGVALGLAVLLILRGEFNLALLAAGAGLWLLNMPGSRVGGLRGNPGGFARRARASQPVRILTDGLDVAVDQRTGAVAGSFTAGPMAGRGLDALSRAECVAGYRWCVAADPQGARILEAYLDRRFAGWREAAEFGHDPGCAQSGGRSRRPVSMSDHEAHHVLGLGEGASREEITRAHRRLMKRYHPDHGGSTAMAARVNEAKDVLMRRHP